MQRRTHGASVMGVIGWSAGWLVLAAGVLADRGAVEQALAEMERAVLAKDEVGYLARVDARDPVFFKEQQNWAKDLQRKPVSTFDLSIGAPGKDRPETFGEDRATFELVMAWTLPATKEGGKETERTVSFPATFVKDEASGVWKFAGEAWEVFEADGTETIQAPAEPAKEADATAPTPKEPHESKVEEPARKDRLVGELAGEAAKHERVKHRVRVRYFPGYEEVAERIAEVLPSVRDRVDAGFGVAIDRVQEIKVYPSMRHLQASIYLSYTEGLSGWNEPGESIKLLVRPNASAKSMRALLAHEYGHVATFEYGEKATDMPWWVLEGVADLSAEIYQGKGEGLDAEMSVINWHTSGKLAEWEKLADFHTVPGNMHRYVYKQGQHMLGYVSDRFGARKRNAWMRAMGEGKTIDEASRATLGMSFSELDTQWREEVAKRAEAKKKAQEEAEAKRAAEDAANTNTGNGEKKGE